MRFEVVGVAAVRLRLVPRLLRIASDGLTGPQERIQGCLCWIIRSVVAAGWRSALSAKTLLDMGVPRVSHIDTGFAGWESDGLPVVTYDELRGR